MVAGLTYPTSPARAKVKPFRGFFPNCPSHLANCGLMNTTRDARAHGICSSRNFCRSRSPWVADPATCVRRKELRHAPTGTLRKSTDPLGATGSPPMSGRVLSAPKRFKMASACRPSGLHSCAQNVCARLISVISTPNVKGQCFRRNESSP